VLVMILRWLKGGEPDRGELSPRGTDKRFLPA
jgi:hypothetical protein